MRHPFYTIYGIALIGLMGFAQFRGWTLNSLNQEPSSPRSVRDNPGAYRSTYGGYSRYTGGK